MNPLVDAIKKVKPAVVSIVITKEISEETLRQMPYFGQGGMLTPQKNHGRNRKRIS